VKNDIGKTSFAGNAGKVNLSFDKNEPFVFVISA